MTAQELNTYIDKVLGNSIRCLLPSYWWKRILSQIVGYVNGVEKKADQKINDLKKTVDNFDVDIDLSDYIKSRAVFKVTAKSERDVTVIADGEIVVIPAGRTMRIPALKNFRFKDGSYHSPINVDKVDVSNAYTTSFTSMRQMFYYCKFLTSLDVSSFDTSNVTNMDSMFGNCSSLTSLDLSNFDTSSITACYDDVRDMFDGCINLTTLILGSNFFKMNSLDSDVDFSSLANWSSESAISSLVTNSYDRTSNGLPNITIKLHANTYAYLTDEHKATLTSKGYDVVSV